MPISYTIAHSWDGEPIPESEWVSLSLSKEDSGDLIINIDAPFYSDPAPQQEKGSFWGLWEYEVVEIFLVGSDGLYTELEFSPHGHYLSLRLDAPRSVIAQEEEFNYEAKIEGHRWTATAVIPQKILPTELFRVNCFAIHGQNENRRYLCYSPLPHEKPDFHQPDRFPLFPKESL